MKIQEFSFGNFRSFKDIQTLNLSAAKIKSKKGELYTFCHKDIKNPVNQLDFLKNYMYFTM